MRSGGHVLSHHCSLYIPQILDGAAVDDQELLDNQAASRLAGAFSTLHLRQGETVAAEGDTVDQCFLIEYGSVEVSGRPPANTFYGLPGQASLHLGYAGDERKMVCRLGGSAVRPHPEVFS